MRDRITDLLGVAYPVVQAPMAEMGARYGRAAQPA